MTRRSIALDPEVHDRLALLRARESVRRKTELNWDEFFRVLLRRERRKREAISWAYALVIFISVTWVLLWPVYLYAPTLIPLIWAVGLIVAAVSVYLLTPFALRKYKPFEEASSEIFGCVEELAAKAGLRKAPLLTISETEEVNAMAYCSPSGGRVCLTRGLVKALDEGKLSSSELKAIIAHEIGHLKHMDSLKFGLALSWVNVFQYFGNETVRVGEGMAKISEASEGWFGTMLAIYGAFTAFLGAVLLLMAKLASALSFHLSRRQEFEADDVAVELTHPEEMSAALERITALNEELLAKELEKLPYADRWQFQPQNTTWVDRLWDTHPPTSSRVERQRSLLMFLGSLEREGG